MEVLDITVSLQIYSNSNSSHDKLNAKAMEFK